MRAASARGRQWERCNQRNELVQDDPCSPGAAARRPSRYFGGRLRAMSTRAEHCALEPSLAERGTARGAGRLGGGAAVQRRQGATEASSSCVGVVDGPEKWAANGAKERRVKDLRCPGLFTRPTPRSPEGGAQAPRGGRRGAPGERLVAVVDGALGRRAGQRPRSGVGCPAPWPTWSHDVGVQAARAR